MLSIGTRLQDRYRITRPFGEGGQGAVYEAFDERLKMPVALKQIFCTDARSLEAFEREALLLARLKHDALPRVIDHFSENQGQFLVMEFIPGDDLYGLLKKRAESFPVDDVVLWGLQLLAVLEYLHTQPQPIIHRDIKPHNLKLDSRGRIVLLDFGLAKDTTASTILRGYSHYYAPLEQKRMRGTDARSDLYAVGATLYHLITNQVPNDAEVRDEAIGAGKPDPLVVASSLNPQVSIGIATVIAEAMSLDRDSRPSSAAVMRDRLIQACSPGAQSESQTPTVVDAPSENTISIIPPSVVEKPEQKLQSSFPRTETKPQASPKPPVPEPMPPAAQKTDQRTEGRRSETKPATPNRMLIAATAVIALVAATTAAWLFLGQRKAHVPAETPNPIDARPAQTAVVAMRCFMDVFDKGGNVLKAGAADVAEGQSFRLRFLPSQPGYLYIIAPGKKNVPTTFLTAMPDPQTGVRTNRLDANREWEFPQGKDNAIGADRDLLENPMTVVYAPQPLAEPASFAARAMRPLNLDEQREFEKWRKQASASAPEVSTESEKGQLATTVKTLSDQIGKEPLIFELKIKRREGQP